jgi:hypothetical protein
MLIVSCFAAPAVAGELATDTTVFSAVVSPQAVVSLSSSATCELSFDEIIECEGSPVRMMIDDGDSFRLVADLSAAPGTTLRPELDRGDTIAIWRVECITP